MPALLTSGSTTLAPFALSNYTSDQEGGAIVHAILGRATPDVTLRPAGMRSGSMTLDFSTDALAASARASLSGAASWTLAHSERTSVNMRFVVRRLSRVLTGDNRWSIALSYEEVP